MMRKKKILVLLFMVLFFSVYVVSTVYINYDHVTSVVATIIAGLGIYGVWYELSRDASIKEAEFLAEFNFVFINSNNLIEMEKKLERARVLKEPLALEERDRQNLINYLVYLESLAPLVLNGLIRLKVIDDLFGYRYFIAVNNKDVQTLELFPEAQFYRGCFKLYKVWSEYRNKNGIPIPLNDSSLDAWEQFDQYAYTENFYGLITKF